MNNFIKTWKVQFDSIDYTIRPLSDEEQIEFSLITIGTNGTFDNVY